ncbi:MAG: aquaporin [Anaerolineae bacterium]|nr:aquaporin [Anaerolineae bacterium]MDW8300320.1 aquaporin [Anaerolineae bacterium]
MPRNLFQVILAEFLATFTLVFIGVSAVAYLLRSQTSTDAGIVVAALAHGFAVIALAYAFGHVSGAHANPAVSFGMTLGGKLSPVTMLIYWAAQFIGGIAAAAVVLYLFGNDATLLAKQHAATALGNDFLKIVLVEGLLTFFFVSTIYQAAGMGRAGNLAGVLIGMTLAGCILAGGSLTGAALNPARYLAPSLVGGDLSNLVPFFVGTLGGGGLAGLLHGALFKGA